jgi:hypothetical protein
LVANHGTTIFTAGVLFPDGRAIDLVRNRRLLYWDGERVDVREEFDIGGFKFRAVDMDGHLEQVLRIPADVVANSTSDGLVEEVIDLYKQLGFDAGNSVVAAAGTLTTWVPECLPGGAPVLNFWGAPGSEGAVLQVMTALSRRPLHLVDASAAKIAALPAGVRAPEQY